MATLRTNWRVIKNGKVYDGINAAGSYEMWDCLGRADITIEQRCPDIDPKTGEQVMWVFTTHRMTRRILKGGRIKYYPNWENSHKETPIDTDHWVDADNGEW